MYLNHSQISSLEQDSLWQLLQLFASKSSPAEKPGVLHDAHAHCQLPRFWKTSIKQNQERKPQSIRCYLPHHLGEIASACATDKKLPVPKVSQLRACTKCLPPALLLSTTKKKKDLSVFIHFNMLDRILTVASLAVAIEKDWQNTVCKVKIAPEYTGESNWNHMDEAWEKIGGKFHGYSSLTLRCCFHFSQSCSVPNHPSSIIFLSLARGHSLL